VDTRRVQWRGVAWRTASVSKLREIQDAAIRSDTEVAVLLRMCLQLAASLPSAQLRELATRELRGYPHEASLPLYRKRFHTPVYGTFTDGHAIVRNQGVAMTSLPEGMLSLRDDLFYTAIRSGVHQIETLVASGRDVFEIPWPADAVRLLAGVFNPRLVLVEASQVVPATAYTTVLGGIRDTILQFVLDLEVVDPEAGEPAPNERPISATQVTQIFTQNFYGANAVVANAGRDVTQTVTTIDVASLEVSMQGLGIGREEQRALIAAVHEDEQDGAAPGPRTRAWYLRLQNGAVALGSSVAVETATHVLGKLLGL